MIDLLIHEVRETPQTLLHHRPGLVAVVVVVLLFAAVCATRFDTLR